MKGKKGNNKGNNKGGKDREAEQGNIRDNKGLYLKYKWDEICFSHQRREGCQDRYCQRVHRCRRCLSAKHGLFDCKNGPSKYEWL